jgi:hypothetical protein
MGAGDVVVGTLFTANSHLFGMMVLTLGFGLLLSADSKLKISVTLSEIPRFERVTIVIAGCTFLISSFLFGTAYFFLFCCFVALYYLKGKTRLVAFLITGLFVGVFTISQQENAQYLFTYLEGGFSGDLIYSFPRKLLALLETIELFSNNISLLLFGTGLGLYNSRAAMVLTNNYLDKDIGFVSMSNYTSQVIHPLWNRSDTLFVDSVVHQPWFSVFQLFTEIGLIAFLLLFLFIGIKLFRLRDERVNIFSIYVIGCMFLDNFLEYPQFMIASYVSFWLILYRPGGQLVDSYGVAHPRCT